MRSTIVNQKDRFLASGAAPGLTTSELNTQPRPYLPIPLAREVTRCKRGAPERISQP